MRAQYRATLLTAAALGTGCAMEMQVDADEEELDLELQEQAVHSAYYRHFEVAFQTSGPDYEATRATGTIFVPFKDPSRNQIRASDGTEIRGTCGVTFVSSRYAITAAHCVEQADVYDPPNQPLVVQRYRVNGSINYYGATAVGGGFFPAWDHARLGPEHGYNVDRFSCRVINRCGGPKYGDFNCPVNEPNVSKRNNLDLALIKCDTRPDPNVYGYVPVAASDNESGPVKMFWSHEIYDVPVSEPYYNWRDTSTWRPYDLWRAYTPYPSWDSALGRYRYEDNFHYFGGERNQLLPLVSRDWATGDLRWPRRRLGRDTGDYGGTMVWTDLFGCHGSSGSGIMQYNDSTQKYELLGPADVLNRDEWNGASSLCVDADNHRAWERSLGYQAAEYTRQLAQVAYNDCFEGFRYCPIWRPFPLPRW